MLVSGVWSSLSCCLTASLMAAALSLQPPSFVLRSYLSIRLCVSGSYS